LSPSLGTLRWTPTIVQVGTQDVVVRVFDGQGGSSTQRFAITVRPVNTPPTITSTPPTEASTQQDYVYAVRATDLDGDALTSSMAGAPAGLEIDPRSGLIRWTATDADVGDHDLTVRVEDGQGGAAVQRWRIAVLPARPSLAPYITSTPR